MRLEMGLEMGLELGLGLGLELWLGLLGLCRQEEVIGGVHMQGVHMHGAQTPTWTCMGTWPLPPGRYDGWSLVPPATQPRGSTP